MNACRAPKRLFHHQRAAGKADAHRRPFSRLGADGDRVPQLLQHLMAQIQAQPCTALAAAPVVAGKAALKNTGQVLCADAKARVLDDQRTWPRW